MPNGARRIGGAWIRLPRYACSRFSDSKGKTPSEPLREHLPFSPSLRTAKRVHATERGVSRRTRMHERRCTSRCGASFTTLNENVDATKRSHVRGDRRAETK